MKAVRTAFAFLTRLPVRAPADPALSRAAAAFPLVGVAVGGVAGGVFAAGSLVLPGPAAALLAVLAGVLLTGGLHEDGWADLADGLGAHVGRERRFEIMRDSRVGTFGALALVVVVAAPLTTVGTLGAHDGAAALVTAHVLGRWAMVALSATTPPASPGGLGGLLRASPATLAVATLIAAAATVPVAGPGPAAAAWIAALASVATATVILRRALGGVTGDGYGATCTLTVLVTAATLTAVAG